MSKIIKEKIYKGKKENERKEEGKESGRKEGKEKGEREEVRKIHSIILTYEYNAQKHL